MDVPPCSSPGEAKLAAICWLNRATLADTNSSLAINVAFAELAEELG
jgi:hypothetical protein